MATGPTLSSALEKMERDFECGICHERYKQPKLLDCTHSFCEHCLKQYRKSQYKDAAKISCPVCRKETVLPETGIPGLKTNFLLISIVEGAALLEKVQKAAGSSKTELLCEICDSSQVTHRCLDCEHNICSTCRKTHLRYSTSSNHTVPTLEDVRKGLVTPKKAPGQDASKCQKHKGEVNRFYCETCHELICRDCTVLDHRNQHHYIDYKEASAKYKQSINNKISHLKRDIRVLQTCLADTAEYKREFNSSVTETRKAVQEISARVIAKVKAEEKRLLKEIDTHERDHNKRLDEHKTAVSKILQRKQHSLETATDVTTTASDSDFLSLYPVIDKDLDMLSSQHPPKISGMRPRPLVIRHTVCDFNLGQLAVEDAWELCREFGKRGSGPGEFERATGIAASQYDEIAVADWKNNRIVIHNNQGESKSSILFDSIDIKATSNQWVAANRDGVVKVYNKDNTLAHKFRTVPQSEVGKTEVRLVSVAAKKNDNIIVGDIKRMVLTEHNPTDGSLIRTMPVEIPPDFLAVMNNEKIAVSTRDLGRLDVVDDNAATIHTIRPTINGQAVNNCRGVCCNSSGIYIAVITAFVKTGHIHHYDNSGTFLSCIIQDLYNPLGITLTADRKQLAVADWYSVKIYQKV